MLLLQPGLLKKVQGMGWYLEEANLAQVSTNILDFEVTPMHMVYEEICRDAKVNCLNHSNLNMKPSELDLYSFDLYRS